MHGTSDLNQRLDDLLRRRMNANWLGKMAGGAVLAVGGLGAAGWLLEHALVVTNWEIGACLSVTCAGCVLVAYGWHDWKDLCSLRRQVARVRAEADDLVAELAEIRKAGGPAHEYLAKQGFTDGELRQYLLGRAKIDAGR